MSHTKPMVDKDGDFNKWKDTKAKCPKCEGKLKVREWDSSCGGYTDYKYKCVKCEYSYWVDGLDS